MPGVRKYVAKIFHVEDLSSLVILEVLLGILFSLWSLTIFAYVTGAVVSQQTKEIDNYIFNQIISNRREFLTPAMHLLSFMGSELIIFSSLTIAIFLSVRRHRRETLIFSLLLLMGLLITFFLKNSFEIPRPVDFVLDIQDTYGFPSGHAINSLVFYSTLSYFVYHLTRSKIKAALSFLFTACLIFLIGFSRVYLGAHHPTDVIGGWIVGTWLFIMVMLIDKTIQYFRIVRNLPPH